LSKTQKSREKEARKVKVSHNPSIVSVGEGFYMTYKRTTELLDILTTLILLISVYNIGMDTKDESIKGQYRIVLVVLFVCTFAPFWISYSALLKIMLMDGRYENFQLNQKGFIQRSVLLFLLTFMAPAIFIIARMVQLVGEVVAILTYLTLS
jgi:hypothetical protein